MSARLYAVCSGLVSITLGALFARAAPPTLLVANYNSSRILEITDSGQFVGEVAVSGLAGPFGANALVFDADGTLLAGNFDNATIVRDLAGMPEVTSIAALAPGGTPDALVYNPAGELFVATRGGDSILRWPAGGILTVFDSGPELGNPLSLAVRGEELFFANAAGQLWRYENFDPQTRLLIGTYGTGGNVAIAISGNQQAVYFLDHGALQRIDPESGATVTVASGMGHADEGLAVYRPFGAAEDVVFAADFAGVVYRAVLGSTPSVTVLADSKWLRGPSALLMRPAPCESAQRCDADCSGTVDSFDIAAFVQMLSDPVGYAGNFPGCDPQCALDLNDDGAVDAFDIAPFVSCLTE